jgi:hypothetical protein
LEGDLQVLLIFTRTTLSIAMFLVALAAQAGAQTPGKEPAVVLELGAAGDWSVEGFERELRPERGGRGDTD